MLKSTQLEAVTALLQERTLGDVCTRVGISRSTLAEWLTQPEFVNALRAAQSEVIAGAVARLTGNATDAIDTLTMLMTDTSAPAIVRLRAADLVLVHRSRLLELTELSERLGAIEKALGVNDE